MNEKTYTYTFTAQEYRIIRKALIESANNELDSEAIEDTLLSLIKQRRGWLK